MGTATMSFRQWVIVTFFNTDPKSISQMQFRALAHDIADDPTFPRRNASRIQLVDYLEGLGADFDAIGVLHRAYDLFETHYATKPLAAAV